MQQVYLARFFKIVSGRRSPLIRLGASSMYLPNEDLRIEVAGLLGWKPRQDIKVGLTFYQLSPWSGHYELVPDYPADDAATARDVLPEMTRRRGWLVVLYSQHNHPDHWACLVTTGEPKDEDRKRLAMVCGGSISLAISKALAAAEKALKGQP